MNKLARLIEEMPLEDLKKIKKDIDEGNMKRLIEKRLREEKRKQKLSCPVCSTSVKEGEGVTLYFGSKVLRKKATFDGIDCLEYFLDRLKRSNDKNEYKNI
ncbi:MAG: hypothetical protein ACOCU6_03380, partial [Nanoarchaeota archaeon]